ncbi:uncharacterized protein LOC142575518 isoform X1 [Dermacentor variabilis]|uniref:uncharacterized protein LOC142575518 isoform X1 n=1 Tax=Dermacentor variabilis TaxID=34621 RepID=UPI003F5B819E
MMVDGQTRRRTPSAEGPPRAPGVGGVGSSSCSDGGSADHDFASAKEPSSLSVPPPAQQPPPATPGGGGGGGGQPSSPAPTDSGTPPPPSAHASSASRSRWLKLRTTVQLSGAISHIQKKPPLKREDSFLKRFSTRHINEPRTGGSDSATSPAGESRPRFFSKPNCERLLLGVINPDENALFVWLWILTWCVLYNAWALILRQTFTELQTSSVHLWFVADSFADLVYLLDIVVQFRTGYLEQGLMVCEARKLAGHYVRSKPFLMDLLALTPLDLLQFQIGIAPLLRFPRFIKVYRCYRFYYMVESRTIYPNLWRVVNLIHILLLLSHWFGCFYYMLSEFENYDGDWTYHKPDSPEWKALGRKYLASLYWSTLTLTTIGDLVTPSSNLQYIFTILCYLIGVFIFATIVGQVGNVITNRNASRLEFERLLDGAKLYMRHHKVPHQMQRRVQRWYDYSWSRGRMQGGGDINSALGCLPDKLKTELALHVNLKTLKKVTIFQECQPEFLHDLVLKMRAYIFTPGDLICRKGEVAREMFIIADGILEVISETGKVLTQMKAGDFFGEIGILNLDGFNRRTADVRSVGYSELFSLSREDVLSAMKDYPEAEEILQAMGRKRLMEARLAASVKKADDIISRSTVGGGTVTGTLPGSAAGAGDGSASPQGSVHSRGPRSMDAMRRLRKDVKNIRQLLRSRTNTTTQKPPDIQLEMDPVLSSMDDHQEDSEAATPSTPVTKSLHKLLRRFQTRQDSQGGQALKGLVTSMSCIKGEEELADLAKRPSALKSMGPSMGTSTNQDSSGTSPVQPIGAGLPLLTRIKMLRDAEKAAKSSAPSDAASKHLSISPGAGGGGVHARRESYAQQDRAISRLEPTTHSSLLERRRLSRLQASMSLASTEVTSAGRSSTAEKAAAAVPSRKSIADVLHRLKPGGDSTSNKQHTPTVTLQVHPPPPSDPAAEAVANQNIPLLKRVLLLKAMEDKKEKESKLQTTATAAAASAPSASADKPSASSSNVVSTKLSPPRPDTLSLSPQRESAPPATSSAQVSLRRTQPAPASAESGSDSGPLQMLSPKFELEDEVFRSPSPVSEPCESKPRLPHDGGGGGRAVSGGGARRSGGFATTISSGPPVTSANSAILLPQESVMSMSQRGALDTLEEAQHSSADSGSLDIQREPQQQSRTQQQQSDAMARLAPPAAPATTTHSQHSQQSFRSRLWSRNTMEGHAARRTLLQRMEAVELESTDAGSYQAPPSRRPPSPRTTTRAQGNGGEHLRGRIRKVIIERPSPENGLEQCLVSELLTQEDGIEQYVAAAMKHIKIAFKTYLHETQDELRNKVALLEDDLKRKDAVICDLQRKLLIKEQELSRLEREVSYLEEVSSLSDTSLTWSDEEDLVLTNESVDSARADPLLEEEEEEEDDGGERGRARQRLAAQTTAEHVASSARGGGRPFLYSWPRASLPNARSHHRHRTPHSSSWHEPSLSTLASASDSALCGVAAARLKPEDLWKLEFPASQDQSKATSIDLSLSTSKMSSGGSCTTLPDLAVPQPYSPPARSGSATSPLLTYPRPPTSANSDDWEVQMLVEEFEKKVQEEQCGSRRHSSCEPLSWSRALSRNLTHVAAEPHYKRHATSTSSPFGSQEEGRRRRLRRKHSLRDDRLLRCLAGRQAPAADARPKLTRFASLDMPRYHRQQQKQHLLQNHYGDEPGETGGFPESSSGDHLRSSSSRGAALKRRAFWQSRQRHNTFFAGQPSSSGLANDKQRLLGAWRSLDEECEPPEDDHRRLQETSFSNECLWQPSPARPQPAAALVKQASTASSVSSSFSSHIAGWPSTPCLPTIKEDTGGAAGAGGTGRHDLTKALKLSSSGSRSYSENCLTDADVGAATPLSLTRRSSSSGGGGTSSSNASTETTIQEPALSPQQRQQQQQQQQQCISSARTTVAMTETVARSTGGLTTVSAVQGKADSVAISIPDTEPIWSLP